MGARRWRPPVCAVVAEGTAEAALALARRVEGSAELVELRVDMLEGPEELEGLGALPGQPAILTLRSVGQGGLAELPRPARRRVLERLIAMRPAFVDLEHGSPDTSLIGPARRAGVGTVLSWHDLARTPPDVARRAAAMARTRADVIKLVAAAASAEDELAMLSLDRRYAGRGVVAFCSGERGHLSRALCPLLGARFTYASAGGRASSLGLPTVGELRMLYEKHRSFFEEPLEYIQH